MSRIYRCPSCRTRRKSYSVLLDHIAKSGHRTCNCGGYHFPHREGSKFCNANPIAHIYLCERYGGKSEDMIRAARAALEDGVSVEDAKDALSTVGFGHLNTILDDQSCSKTHHSITHQSEN